LAAQKPQNAPQSIATIPTPKPESVVAPVAQTKEQNDRRLHDMQKSGIGGHITFAQPMADGSRPAHNISSHDNERLEKTIAKARAADVMQTPAQPEHHGELAVSGESKDRASNNIDEIFVDVRGKLHHTNQTTPDSHPQ